MSGEGRFRAGKPAISEAFSSIAWGSTGYRYSVSKEIDLSGIKLGKGACFRERQGVT